MTVQADKLVKMAEQITANMSFTDDEAIVAAKVADHLNRFWDPRMRSAIAQFAVDNAEQLSPALRSAIPLLH
jgi:formate dehydrogenase subunit delta